MINLDVLPVAQIEFDCAVDWYAGQSIRAANRFVSEFESAIDGIQRHPDQQLRWDDIYNLRMLNKFPYYVVFRRTTDLVVIVAVRHTSQDQDAWRDR